MTDLQKDLGGSPLPVAIAPKDWKALLIDFLFAQGAVAVILSAWLGWTIYNGQQIENSRTEAAQRRMEWEQKLWDKIDIRLTELSKSYTDNLEKIIAANERKTERDEIRFDQIVNKIRGN